MTHALPRRSRTESCLSDLQLDQLRVDELDAARAMAARTHIAECERCHARAEALAAADEAELPPLELPTAAAPEPRRWWRPALASLAAAAAIAIVVWPQPESSTEAPAAPTTAQGEPASPTTRSKGTKPTLSLFVRREGAVVPAHDLEFLVPGDTLGFTYSSTRTRHLAILGRDGAGLVSVYLPSLPINAGSAVQVGDGIELDDTLGEELVYGIFCDEPLAPEALRATIEAAPLAPVAPTGCDVVTLRNTKRKAR